MTRFQAGTTATITITRTGGSLGAVTAALAQTGGTAVAGTDYTGLPASVSFLSGQTTTTISFTVPASAAGAGARTLILGLSSPTNAAVLGTATSPTLTIAQPLVVSPPTLPPGALSTAYAQTLTATGTPGPFTFSVSAGSLPPGLTLNPASGAVTGTPTTTGAFTFTILATDPAAQATGTRQYTVNVFPRPTLSPSALPSGSVGTAYNQTVTATAGASPGPFTFAVTSGTLPAGLTLNATTGAITGTPTTTGTSNFSIRATDASTTATGQRAYSIFVSPTPVTITLSPTTLPGGVTGGAYNQTLTATGGTAPFTFAVSAGTLPAGLTLSSGGVLAGTPTAAGVSTFTVTATDALGNTGSRQYTLTVGTTPPRLPSSYAVGQDTGGGTVNVYDAAGGVTFTVNPFGSGYTAGVRTAVADVTGDGVADLLVASGPGVPVGVQVISGATNQVVATLNPFELGFLGGAYVTAGDITGDGIAEVVVTPDQSGGPRVVVFQLTGTNTFTQTASFFGIDDPNFRGGVRAAVTDVNGDGIGDLIVAAGFGGGPRVAVFNGLTVGTGGQPTKLFNDFFAFDPSLRDGIYVAGGDINADGFGDLVTGGGPGGGPRVQTLSGAVATAAGGVDLAAPPAGLVLSNFFAGDPNNRGGIRVATKNLNADANADLVTGSGQGGREPDDDLPGEQPGGREHDAEHGVRRLPRVRRRGVRGVMQGERPAPVPNGGPARAASRRSQPGRGRPPPQRGRPGPHPQPRIHVRRRHCFDNRDRRRHVREPGFGVPLGRHRRLAEQHHPLAVHRRHRRQRVVVPKPVVGPTQPSRQRPVRPDGVRLEQLIPGGRDRGRAVGFAAGPVRFDHGGRRPRGGHRVGQKHVELTEVGHATGDEPPAEAGRRVQDQKHLVVRDGQFGGQRCGPRVRQRRGGQPRDGAGGVPDLGRDEQAFGGGDPVAERIGGRRREFGLELRAEEEQRGFAPTVGRAGVDGGSEGVPQLAEGREGGDGSVRGGGGGRREGKGAAHGVLRDAGGRD